MVGVAGKRCLWAALRHIAPQETQLDIEELDRLLLRAERQLADLEEQRLTAVSEAVAAAERA